MDLSYGASYFDRERGNLPSFPVVNMFTEQAPTEESPVLQSRPGMEDTGTVMGSGPVKALYQTDGVLGNALFGISAGQLYSSSSSLGAIDGTGPAKLAAFETLVFANQGKSVYKYNGTTLTVVTEPDVFDVLDIAVGASRLIVIDKGTGRFYWSDALTDVIDPLSFATAENSPDSLKACLYIGDTLILFGSKTVEFWPVTTDPDNPFQPLVGRVFQVGIRDTGCATEFQGTFAWVTDKNQVCMQDPKNIISHPDIEAKLAASTGASLWTFNIEGIEFLAVRTDTQTFVYNSRSQTWSVFESNGNINFIPQCSTGNVMGSSIDGRIVQWTDDHKDFGSVLERRFRAGSPIKSTTLALNNVALRTNPGQTPDESSGYTDPIIELRTSKDGGFNWSAYRPKPLGRQGEYRRLIQWRSLGFFGQPGVMVEFRVTDPVPFRVSGVTANEPYGNI
jgi:hypothetical protein